MTVEPKNCTHKSASWGERVLNRLPGGSSMTKAWIAFGILILAGTATAGVSIPNLFPFFDLTGAVANYSSTGSIDRTNTFFQSLGTNGRTCGTCHLPAEGMGLSATDAQLRYLVTGGKDPLFAAVDGAACPTAAPGKHLNYTPMLKSGLVRIALPIPDDAQFTITAAQDPYGCALTTNDSGQTIVSFYRRPLPTTNLNFLSSVMFDGRETVAPLNEESTYTANLTTDLTQQALDATLTHAQAEHPPTPTQLSLIVNFELALNSAQLLDFKAGKLSTHGGNGGPKFLSTQEFYPGINDSLGGDPHGQKFDPNVFTIYSAWENSRSKQQQSIYRGEQIFNTTPLTITAVSGLNDVLGQPTIIGTCTTCHDTPNVGDHSFALPLDIGTSHPLAYEQNSVIVASLQQLSVPTMPVFQIACTQGTLAGQTFYTSDPGKAMITGQCSDITRGKGLILRGLAARAPYFHNGAAASLTQVANFYNQRFQMSLTQHEIQDLVNFLQTL